MTVCPSAQVEAMVGSLFGMVVIAYCLELFFIRPSVLGVVDGLLPRLWFKNKEWGYSEWLRCVLFRAGQAWLAARTPRAPCAPNASRAP